VSFITIIPRVAALTHYALPIAGGVTLYVAASDLIPEVNHHAGKNPLVVVCILGGAALFFATQQLL
jgi:zinc transporter ZupT